jgi:hypothetical protein
MPRTRCTADRHRSPDYFLLGACTFALRTPPQLTHVPLSPPTHKPRPQPASPSSDVLPFRPPAFVLLAFVLLAFVLLRRPPPNKPHPALGPSL